MRRISSALVVRGDRRSSRNSGGYRAEACRPFYLEDIQRRVVKKRYRRVGSEYFRLMGLECAELIGMSRIPRKSLTEPTLFLDLHNRGSRLRERDDYSPCDNQCAADQYGAAGRLTEEKPRDDLCGQKKENYVESE